ncbi:hypothetical protein J1N35_026493 [Gossypium stocksii]|uniref:Uncharacterized protein n=1 Tax=Gossypium stocksii TaxID=47602 RepID=A0A9D3V8R2_9ROSI|nr:hypothetical protein J1N35_026493 [Gossypium stocksii]
MEFFSFPFVERIKRKAEGKWWEWKGNREVLVSKKGRRKVKGDERREKMSAVKCKGLNKQINIIIIINSKKDVTMNVVFIPIKTSKREPEETRDISIENYI